MPNVDYHIRELKKAGVWSEARRHVKALVKAATPEALRALGEHGMGNRNGGVVYPTMEALVKVGYKAVPTLIEYGLERDFGPSVMHKDIREGIGKTHDMKAINLLFKHIAGIKYGREKDKNAPPHTARTTYLWEVLESMGTKELIRQGMINHRDPYVASVTVDVLSFDRSKAVTRLLMEQGLANKREEVAARSVRILAERDCKRAFPKILRLGLKSGRRNGWLMVESVEALAKLDPKRAVAPIIEYGMKSGHPDVVRRSITTLKRLDPKEAVQPIIDYGLKSSRIDLIIPSVKALEEIGDPRALPRLMMLADHEDKDVRGDVKTAIRRIRRAKRA